MDYNSIDFQSESRLLEDKIEHQEIYWILIDINPINDYLEEIVIV